MAWQVKSGIYEAFLIDRFGEEQVFRDVEIRPGEDFAEAIETAIASCSALLVVLGPHWLEHRNEKGEPRLHEPGDWVRLEIEAALTRNKWVVPILVDNDSLDIITSCKSTSSSA